MIRWWKPCDPSWSVCYINKHGPVSQCGYKFWGVVVTNHSVITICWVLGWGWHVRSLLTWSRHPRLAWYSHYTTISIDKYSRGKLIFLQYFVQHFCCILWSNNLFWQIIPYLELKEDLGLKCQTQIEFIILVYYGSMFVLWFQEIFC